MRGRISTKSSSTFSVSEEDDVRVTGSSPSKSRKQLNEEADEFLSKLRQRAERGKGKRQEKKTLKKGNGTKTSPVENSTRQTSTRKNSPLKNPDTDDQVGMSSMSSNVRASSRDSNFLSTSPMRMSPGCHSPSDLSTRMTSRGCNSPRVGTLQTSSRGCKSPRGSSMQASPRGNKSPRGINPLSVSSIAPDVVTIENSPPLSPVLLQSHDLPHNSQTKRNEGEKMEECCGRQTLGENEADLSDPGDVEIVETCADKTEVGLNGDIALSTTSSPRDVMSPPVPSPSYSFLEHLSSPGSPALYGSPPPQKNALSPDPLSPSLPVDWKSPASDRRLGPCPQPNSPISPSVCSYSSQVARSVCSENRKKDAVKNLEKNFEENLNDKEKPRSVEVVEIDPNVPLMERLKAARGGGHKIFSFAKDEDSNSDDCCAKLEAKSDEKESTMVSSRPEKVTNSHHEMNEVENTSMGADFDFFDDGGFNFDIEELNNLDGCSGDENNVKAHKDCHSKDETNEDRLMPKKKGSRLEGCHSKEEVDEVKVMPQKKATNRIAGERKIPLSQRRVQDSDDEDKSREAPPKRGKKTDTQSGKASGQRVRQPVTPMPNYNEMATPVLKVSAERKLTLI